MVTALYIDGLRLGGSNAPLRVARLVGIYNTCALPDKSNRASVCSTRCAHASRGGRKDHRQTRVAGGLNGVGTGHAQLGIHRLRRRNCDGLRPETDGHRLRHLRAGSQPVGVARLRKTEDAVPSRRKGHRASTDGAYGGRVGTQHWRQTRRCRYLRRVRGAIQLCRESRRDKLNRLRSPIHLGHPRDGSCVHVVAATRRRRRNGARADSHKAHRARRDPTDTGRRRRIVDAE